MAIVPENRRLFGPMTVLETSRWVHYLIRDTKGRKEDFERVYHCSRCCTSGEASSPARFRA
jgi:ABC-type branched-subunit amino acid transport system ATPase component